MVLGRKLNALFGRSSSSSKPAEKFKPLLNLAVKRLTVQEKRRQSQFTQVKCDVVNLLYLNHHEQALLRVQQVIKEKNMVEVYVMMEGFCFVLIERIELFERERESCPDELKEAITSLIFASSRCGDLPELQEFRVLLGIRYGKEFVDRSLEPGNNSGVNKDVIQKLETKMPPLGIRMLTLKEIATEYGITLHLDESSISKDETEQNIPKVDQIASSSNEKTIKDERFSSSLKQEKFRDVAHASEVACEAASFAAMAARAAVELSKSNSYGPGGHDKFGSSSRKSSRGLGTSTEGPGTQTGPTQNLERKIMSMRTRRVNAL